MRHGERHCDMASQLLFATGASGAGKTAAIRAFIRAALGGTRAGIVLLDCERSVRSHRLRTHREQPELDTHEMQCWAAYLRGQADALGLPIIDTTAVTPDEVADELYALACTASEWGGG